MLHSNVPFEYSFQCQLAHGSRTETVSNFKTLPELYAMIASRFHIDINDIMFCTLNTHEVNMEDLLFGDITLTDTIYVHIRGQRKEITLKKTSPCFGLTLTENGLNSVFIKKIHPGKMIAEAVEECGWMLQLGDQVERVNNFSCYAKRHYQVAAYLRDIPVGTEFLLRLVSPEKSAFELFHQRNRRCRSVVGVSAGLKTIRLKYNGVAVECEVNEVERRAVVELNRVVGDHLGFEDYGFAHSIYELCADCPTPFDLMLALNETWGDYRMSQNLITQLWWIADMAHHYKQPKHH